VRYLAFKKPPWSWKSACLLQRAAQWPHGKPLSDESAPRRLTPPASDLGNDPWVLTWQAEGSARFQTLQGNSMNSIIYIVGLVVIVGVILSYFGFR
jgi:hypothetical protein